jgi:DNA-binding transcriptional ArsR family regulator
MIVVEAAALELVSENRRAGILLHPLRLRILNEARRAASATEIASVLKLSRQKVNYHVRELARARFLKRAGRHRKRNMIEQRYIATARAYVLAPEILGPLTPNPLKMGDVLSASYLVALAAQVEGEVGRLMRSAAQTERRVPTLAVSSEICFESAAQREQFARALTAAVVDVVAKNTTPSGAGPYRLMIGCYPIPKEKEDGSKGSQGDSHARDAGAGVAGADRS